MTPLAWAIISVMIGFFIINFIVVCPDKLPWNRRKKDADRTRDRHDHLGSNRG